ncbi:Protein of unknown function [Pyronema omphalodes CBS 100304]|uniref:Uncharacterized protein n=1 Tax=Pyronema omphalodes (strain CBS 100304) TaxID=1076935 RepID=U4KZG4_PYROM|nr:Protein of unknown function [Pyronema omphalodes CBS 100304]
MNRLPLDMRSPTGCSRSYHCACLPR